MNFAKYILAMIAVLTFAVPVRGYAQKIQIAKGIQTDIEVAPALLVDDSNTKDPSEFGVSAFEIKAINYTPDIVMQGNGSVEAEISTGLIKNYNPTLIRLLFQSNGVTQEECKVGDPKIVDGGYKIQCTLSPNLLTPIGPRSLLVQMVNANGSVRASANSDYGYSVAFNPDLCGKTNAICVTGSNSPPNINPIQNAINQAHAGDTVFVGPGSWGLVQQLNVDKAINLVGDMAAGKTEIYPVNQDMGIINLTSSNVLIQGLTLRSATITNPSGHTGGAAIAFNAHQNLGIDHVIASDNIDICGGGAIALQNSTNVLIIHSQFMRNSVYHSVGGNPQCLAPTFPLRGGAIASFNGSGLKIIHSVFKENRSDSMDGGAVFLYNTLSDTIDWSSFTGNHSLQGGGALVIYSLTTSNQILIDHSAFSSNSAGGGWPVYTGPGGAVHISGVGYATVTNSTFDGNQGDYGGALRMASIQGIPLYSYVAHNTFNQNLAGMGGAARLDRLTGTFEDNTLMANSCKLPGVLRGGALDMEQDQYTPLPTIGFNVRSSRFINNGQTNCTQGADIDLWFDSSYQGPFDVTATIEHNNFIHDQTLSIPTHIRLSRPANVTMSGNIWDNIFKSSGISGGAVFSCSAPGNFPVIGYNDAAPPLNINNATSPCKTDFSNFSQDPLFVDDQFLAVHPESPVIRTAHDGSYIGVWQGTDEK